MKTWIKVVAFVVLSVIFLLLGASFFADDWLGSSLKKKIAKASNQQLGLSFENLSVDLLRQNIVIEEPRLNSQNSDSITIWAKRLAITDFDVTSFIFSKKLEIDSLSIEGAQAKILQKPKPEKKTAFNWQAFDISPQVLKSFKKVQVEHLYLDSLQLIVKQVKNDSIWTKLNLLAINSIVIDSGTYLTEDRLLYAKQWQLNLDSLSQHSGSSSVQLAKCQLMAEGSLISMQAKAGLLTNAQHRVSLKGFSINELEVLPIKNKWLTANDLSIQKIDVNILEATANANDEKNKKLLEGKIGELSLAKILPATVKAVTLNTFTLDQFSIDKVDSLHVKGKLEANSIRLDILSAFANNRFFHTSSINFQLDTFNTQAVQFSALALNSKAGSTKLSITSANVTTENITGQISALMLTDLQIDPQSIIKAANVSLRAPVVILAMKNSAAKSENKQGFDAYSAIAPFANRISLNQLTIDIDKLQVSTSNNEQKIALVNKLHITGNKLEIKDDNAASKHVLFADNWMVNSGQSNIYPPKSNFNLGFAAIQLNTSAQFAEIKGMHMQSKQFEFPFKKLPSSRYKLAVQQLSINGLDFYKAQQQDFWANSVAIKGLNLIAKKDKQIDDNTKKPMAHEWFLMPKLGLNIETLKVTNGNVTYLEKHKGTPEPGLLEITDLSVEAKNLTNNEQQLRKNQLTELSGSGLLEGEGRFATKISLYMQQANHPFEVEGKIDSINLKKFNDIAQFTGAGMIKEGTLLGANWTFSADSTSSEGTLEFLYNELKLQVNTGDKADTSGIFQDAASGLLNLLVVEEEVLPSEDEAKPKAIAARRDPTKGFFNYYWITLFNGIKEFVGLPNKSADGQP